MPLSRRQLTFIGAVLLIVLVVAALFLFGRRTDRDQISGRITFWGVFDAPETMARVIAAYNKINPKVEIQYKRLNANTYENDLINALATAEGPDIFMIHNSWLPKHFDKIHPLSESELPIVTFRKLFPSVVEQDFAPDGVIYGLPLYIDTLAMFYNKDLFDTAGIAVPPKTWTEFQNLVPKLGKIDRSGKIVRSAAAIGGSDKSINRATDILNLLFLQSGAPMVSRDFTSADFSKDGLQSINFYAQFANPSSPHYTWNNSLPYSIDHFIEGNSAVLFNYSHQIPIIKEKNPFLEFAVAPMPQPKDAVTAINWANYWGLAVSAKNQSAVAGWDFIKWLTTNEQPSLNYLKETRRPPALRSLIHDYAIDPDLSVFASQALTARSWPQIDSAAVEKSFSNMIDDVISGRTTASRAIQQSETEITQLMGKRR